MTLGVAIFASVVLILLVYNKPFRKAAAWVGIMLVGLALVGSLGFYLYKIHEEHARAKAEAAAHETLVDACVARLQGYKDEKVTSSGILTVCEKKPEADVFDLVAANDTTSRPAFDPNAPYGRLIEIRGGDTLKVVRDPDSKSQTTNLDMSTFIPLVYLGHGQKFVFACGSFGEEKVPTKFPTIKGSTLSCP